MISHSLLYVSVHDLLFVPAPAILAGRALPLQDAVMGNTATIVTVEGMYLVISHGIFALQLLCLMGFCSFLELLEPQFLLFANSGIQSFLESADINLCLWPAMPLSLAGMEITAKKTNLPDKPFDGPDLVLQGCRLLFLGPSCSTLLWSFGIAWRCFAVLWQLDHPSKRRKLDSYVQRLLLKMQNVL